MNKKVEKTLHYLQLNNMGGYFVQGKTQLLDLLSNLISPGKTVGCGDSVTLEATGVLDFLRNGNYVFNDKHRSGLSKEEKRQIYLSNFSADTFLTGVNALTTDGKLFNIDGNGSRVAPILYGPEQVIAVVGINKLVDSAEEAVTRARQIAAPLDAKRLNKETPCTLLGKCIDCRHKQRICNDFVLITGQFVKDRIKVIIINKSYGF